MVIEIIFLIYTIINNVLKIFFIHRLEQTDVVECNCESEGDENIGWMKSFIKNYSIFKLVLQILSIIFMLFYIKGYVAAEKGLRVRPVNSLKRSPINVNDKDVYNVNKYGIIYIIIIVVLCVLQFLNTYCIYKVRTNLKDKDCKCEEGIREIIYFCSLLDLVIFIGLFSYGFGKFGSNCCLLIQELYKLKRLHIEDVNIAKQALLKKTKQLLGKNNSSNTNKVNKNVTQPVKKANRSLKRQKLSGSIPGFK